MGENFMGNGGIFERHADHLCASEFAPFADGISNFTGFSQTNPDFAALVSDNHERAEIEAAAAFDDFGGAIDEDDLLNQLLLASESRVARLGCGPAAPATAWAASAW
jgi:hypothetical protein